MVGCFELPFVSLKLSNSSSFVDIQSTRAFDSTHRFFLCRCARCGSREICVAGMSCILADLVFLRGLKEDFL